MSEFNFTDRKGRVWDLTLTMAGARRIDSSDFSAITDKKFSFIRPAQDTFMEIYSNPALIWAMIWAIVHPQAEDMYSRHKSNDPGLQTFPFSPKESPVEAEAEFLDGIDGESATTGKEAFWKSMGNFFRDHQSVLSTSLRQLELAQSKLKTKLTQIEPVIEERFEREMDREMKKLRETLMSDEPLGTT